MVQALGEKIKEDEVNQVKTVERNELYGQREAPILFEEADGVYINIQGKDRFKSGKKLDVYKRQACSSILYR